MSSSGTGDPIEEHGTPIDEEKKRVRCRYCGKEVRGFNRLKHHLGGIGSDVTACAEVPADIKLQMRDALLERKKERLLKEVGEIYHPDLPLKRNFTPASSEIKHSQQKPTETSSLGKRKAAAADTTSEESVSGSSCHNKQTGSSESEKGKNVPGPLKEEHANGSAPDSCIMEERHVVVKEELKEDTTLHAARCIGKFFYEAGVDLTVMKFPSFQRMIDAVTGCGAAYKVPRYDELRGWILQDELKEVHMRVEDVKCSWEQTGCSILLDGWTDQKGRNLIGFLVDCPQGTVFLRSVDASYAVHDVDALVLLLSRVIEEVGVQNVVQIIAHDTSCYMEAAGKKLVEKYRTIFWTLCADHCINLILDKIGMMEHVKKVLTMAKTITKFIYSHALPLELMRKHMQGRDLVKSSKLKSVAPFMTLENMVSERESLMHIFNSPTWHASSWASRSKGKTIADLAEDSAFWAAADDVLKVSTPLIGVLHQINKGGMAPMGFLYDAMDRAKEAIRRDLGGEEVKYLPYWTIIDDVWDNYLHSPLHSAGYYLNPSLFYSNDFFVDAEVTNGLLCCIIRMVEDRHNQDLIVLQLDAYRAPMGGFAEEIAVDQRAKLPPALWWSLYGGQSPELQRLAIRILSQTCSGTARYKLRKSLSEQVHAKGRNCIEQQRSCDMEFVHNNLRLWNSTLNVDQKEKISLDDLNPLDDWIVEGMP